MRVANPASEPLLELKFGQVGIANLRLNQNDPVGLRAEIEQKLAAAPQLFGRAPVVLDLSRLPQLPDVGEARALLDAINAAGMLAVGLSYSTTENEDLARQLGVPLFAKFRAVYERAESEQSNVAPATNPVKTKSPVRARTSEAEALPAPVIAATLQTSAVTSQLHEKAVRSGQQVYARGRDLIVHAMVANGAEVIADGSIHIYGRLSGRALAGAQGDPAARIFCMDFQAELVSIAGRYRVFEEMPPELHGKPVQAWLEGERLLIEALAT